MGSNLVMIILVGLAAMCIYEGKFEVVVMDRDLNLFSKSSYDFICNEKPTYNVSSPLSIAPTNLSELLTFVFDFATL